MTDPRRLRDDPSAHEGLRDLIRSAPLPTELPRSVSQRGRHALENNLTRTVNWPTLFLGAAALVAAFALVVFALFRSEPDLVRSEPEATREEIALTPMNERPSKPASPTPTPRETRRRLLPSPSGWLNRDTNEWGAHGFFYVDASKGSNVSQPQQPTSYSGEGWAWTNEGSGRLCLRGTATDVQDGDFKTYWGVVAGFNLCESGPDLDPPNTTFSITECPWGSLKNFSGVRFDLEGPDIPSDLRLIFSEIDSKENAFVAFIDAEAGTYQASLSEARVSYQQPPRPARRERVRGVELLIPSRMMHETMFDFCISNLQLL